LSGKENEVFLFACIWESFSEKSVAVRIFHSPQSERLSKIIGSRIRLILKNMQQRIVLSVEQSSLEHSKCFRKSEQSQECWDGTRSDQPLPEIYGKRRPFKLSRGQIG
jgi:hypothetical protein